MYEKDEKTLNSVLLFQMVDCPPVEDDIQLILQAGMWELWLIDRSKGATDQIHWMMAEPGKLESLLSTIAGDRAEVLPTINVSLLTYKDTQPLVIDHGKDYVVLLSLTLGELGGHYASYYVTPRDVEVFDSMVSSSSRGVYTDVFLELARLLFPRRIVRAVRPAPGEATLQPTGGFLWITPDFIATVTDDHTRKILQLCNHQAQDHFCWAWGVLYLHSRLVGIDLGSTRRWLTHTSIPPLALIKSYLWLLLSVTGEQLPPEFHHDFLSIWDASNRKDPADYRRYLLRLDAMAHNLTSLTDCLTLVLPPTRIQLIRQEQREPVPVQCTISL